jgi:hypothetical protein
MAVTLPVAPRSSVTSTSATSTLDVVKADSARIRSMVRPVEALVRAADDPRGAAVTLDHLIHAAVSIAPTAPAATIFQKDLMRILQYGGVAHRAAPVQAADQGHREVQND